MFYSKKFKIILICSITILILVLISVGLINRNKRIKELRQLEQVQQEADIINNESINTNNTNNTNNIDNNINGNKTVNNDVNNNSNDTSLDSNNLPLRDRIDLPETYQNLSEEQLEEVDRIKEAIIGTWTGVENSFVKYTFTENTFKIEVFDKNNSLKESQVYKYEILNTESMLVEKSGNVNINSYKLVLREDKATLYPPIKNKVTILTKDNYVYKEPEQTTQEETSTEETSIEQSSKSIEEIIGIDSNETFEFEEFTEFEFTENSTETTTYENYVTLTIEENNIETTTENKDKEEIIETTTEKNNSSNEEKFDDWLSDYLKKENE